MEFRDIRPGMIIGDAWGNEFVVEIIEHRRGLNPNIWVDWVVRKTHISVGKGVEYYKNSQNHDLILIGQNEEDDLDIGEDFSIIKLKTLIFIGWVTEPVSK